MKTHRKGGGYLWLPGIQHASSYHNRSPICKMQPLFLGGDSLNINMDRGLFISVCTFNQFFCSFQRDVNSLPVRGVGSNQLRQRIIKIYDSHSESHHTVTAIATYQLYHPHPQPDWHPLHSLSSVWFNVHLENCQNTSGAPDNSCAVSVLPWYPPPTPPSSYQPYPPKVYECLKRRTWGTSEKGCQVQRTQWQSPLTIGSGIKVVAWVKLG